MKSSTIILYLLCFLMPSSMSSLFAQGPVLAQAADPLGDTFFPPELIMQNQQAVGLSEEQKTYIIFQIQEAQGTFTKLNWSLQKEMETMIRLTNQTKIDEKLALSQLDNVLRIEEQVKKAQITLMVRIKNKLTIEQQVSLKHIKAQQSVQK